MRTIGWTFLLFLGLGFASVSYPALNSGFALLICFGFILYRASTHEARRGRRLARRRSHYGQYLPAYYYWL